MNTHKHNLQYAFIDESGGISVSKGNHFIVIAALCSESSSQVGRLIKQIHKKTKCVSRSGEVKGSNESPKVKHTLLEKLSTKHIQIYSLIVDRAVLQHPPKDPEDIYRLSTARIIKTILQDHHLESVYLDKRYTKIDLRSKLEKTIRENLSNSENEGLSIYQADSVSKKELQVIDIVAWSLFQKYENNNLEYYKHIIPQIVSEDYITKQIWDNNILK